MSSRAMRYMWLSIRRIVKSPYLSLVLRVYIGMIFIYASMNKISYPAEFSEALAAYRILPYWSINFVAVALPWIELVTGLFLILGLRTRAAALVIGSFLFLFTMAIFINLIRQAPISCGCFDTVGDEITWWHIPRDIAWMLLTVQVFLFDRIYLLRRESIFQQRLAGDHSASR